MEKIKEKIGAVLAVLIVAAIIFAVIAVISLFGGLRDENIRV